MYWVSFQEEFSPRTNISFPQNPLLQYPNQGEVLKFRFKNMKFIFSERSIEKLGLGVNKKSAPGTFWQNQRLDFN